MTALLDHTLPRSLAGAILAVMVLGLPCAGAWAAPSETFYARVGIHEIGHARLAALQAHPGLRWWIEVDDQLLVLTDAATVETLERDVDIERLDLPVEPGRLRLVVRGHQEDLAAMAVDVLARGGRHAVIQARHDGEIAMPDHGHDDSESAHVDMQLLPFRAGTVLARQVANDPPRTFGVDPAIEALVDEADAQRWFADVQSLTGFNRWTHSPGVLDARDWLVEQFEAMPGLTVTTPSFDVDGTTAYNVIATLPGSVRPNEWYILGAHYDSRAETSAQSQVASPGAEDNASGCAAVLEQARIFTANPPEATMLFVCFSGEEQGLWGSVDHVAGLQASGDDTKVRGVLNMDMISYTSDADLDCLIGSRPEFPDILDRFVEAAGAYTALRVVTSLTMCCSDHVPYLNAGLATVVAASNDWFQYPHYHRSTDTAPNVSLVQAEQVLRMNVAAVAGMVGAGSSTLIFANGFESGDLGGWSAP
ncbi:MAG: M28 family peptidase [Acidobacteriota bacterium]